MTRILLFEPAYNRIKDRLPAGAEQILLLGPDGAITQNGRPVSTADARFEISWLSGDFYMKLAPVRAFMDLLHGSTDLRWLHSDSAGLDNPAFGALMKNGVRLTNNHSQAIAMAEYVMAGVLDHFQRGPERREAQSRREWLKIPFREIDESTWLIVGFGAIGRAVARRVRPFGARVVGVRRRVGVHDLADAMIAPGEIARHVPEADVIVLSPPLNPHTANMVDAAFLAGMKPGSVLVNVGRGGLVDEKALLAALDRGRPEHAILDVFRTEPLPEDSPFWGHPRVRMTGHASPLGTGLTARSDRLFLQNLGSYLVGQPMRNEVDLREVLGA